MTEKPKATTIYQLNLLPISIHPSTHHHTWIITDTYIFPSLSIALPQIAENGKNKIISSLFQSISIYLLNSSTELQPSCPLRNSKDRFWTDEALMVFQ